MVQNRDRLFLAGLRIAGVIVVVLMFAFLFYVARIYVGQGVAAR